MYEEMRTLKKNKDEIEYPYDLINEENIIFTKKQIELISKKIENCVKSAGQIANCIVYL